MKKIIGMMLGLAIFITFQPFFPKTRKKTNHNLTLFAGISHFLTTFRQNSSLFNPFQRASSRFKRLMITDFPLDFRGQYSYLNCGYFGETVNAVSRNYLM